MKVYPFIFYCFSVLTLLNCAPQKVEQSPEAVQTHIQKTAQNPIQPNRSQAPIKAVNVIMLPDFPVQVNVAAVVELKNSCTTVNEIYQNQRGDTFLIEILETQQKQLHCKPQPVLSEYIIPLDVRNLSAGHYTVYVNQTRGHFELLVDN